MATGIVVDWLRHGAWAAGSCRLDLGFIGKLRWAAVAYRLLMLAYSLRADLPSLTLGLLSEEGQWHAASRDCSFG